jgi:hypothetical protein
MDREDRELEAARIIDSPLFEEAFQEVTNDVVNQIADCDSTNLDALQALQIELKTVARVRYAIEYFLQMGKIADYNDGLETRIN